MRLSIVGALLGVLAGAQAADAQRPITLGVAGGVSMPQGRFGDRVDPGWHALGSLVLATPMQPLGLRLDAAYNRFEGADDAGGTALPAGASRTAATLTLNPTYRLPSAGWPLAPYLIGGAGAYHLACTGDASGDGSCDATTRLGWNAGLGTRFIALGLRGFVEARYHRVALPGGAEHFVPVTIGLTL